MCHFITLIAPIDDVEAVRAVMDRHGRTAESIENPSVREVLQDEERQYLTVRGFCDCGTVLASRHHTSDVVDEKRAREAARMARRGWSEAKIARALDGMRKAEAKQAGHGPDSIALWSDVLTDLGQSLNLPHAGLMVRSYTGLIATENFVASRRRVSQSVPVADALGLIEPDEVTIFPLR